jgi:hypothetical protein
VRALSVMCLSALVLGNAGMVAAQTCGGAMDVSASASTNDIAKAITKQFFEGIPLDATQEKKAIAIIADAWTAVLKLDYNAADYRTKRDTLIEKRNAALLAVLSNEADKARLAACLTKMQREMRGH